MMKLTLIRHAQSMGNIGRDVPLCSLLVTVFLYGSLSARS